MGPSGSWENATCCFLRLQEQRHHSPGLCSRVDDFLYSTVRTSARLFYVQQIYFYSFNHLEIFYIILLGTGMERA